MTKPKLEVWESLPMKDMTRQQFYAALGRLGLSIAGQRTALALGVSVRRCQGYAGGAAVPDPVARLLAMYSVYGLPPTLDREVAEFQAELKERRAAARRKRKKK